ncbi:4008_t:CDS:2, partial [Racocetra persica]
AASWILFTFLTPISAKIDLGYPLLCKYFWVLVKNDTATSDTPLNNFENEKDNEFVS